MAKKTIFVSRAEQEASRKGNPSPCIVLEEEGKRSIHRELKILGPSRIFFNGNIVVLETESDIEDGCPETERGSNPLATGEETQNGE